MVNINNNIIGSNNSSSNYNYNYSDSQSSQNTNQNYLNMMINTNPYNSLVNQYYGMNTLTNPQYSNIYSKPTTTVDNNTCIINKIKI